MLTVSSSKRWLATVGMIASVACSKHRGVTDGAVTSPTPSGVAGSRSSSAGASAQAGRSAGRNTAGAGGRVAGRGAGSAGAAADGGDVTAMRAGQSGGSAGASEAAAGSDADSSAAGSGGSAGANEIGGHSGSSGATAGNDGSTAGVAAGSSGTKADGASGAAGGPGAAGVSASQAGTGGTDSVEAGTGEAGTDGAAGNTGGDALGDTPLVDITTQEQATAVCARVGESTANARWGDGTQGICAQRGILAEMSGQSTCAAVQAACVMEPAARSACTLESLVDCADVTVSEYVACRAANIKGHLEYSAKINCSTVLANLPPEPTPAACEQPYARCPALRP